MPSYSSSAYPTNSPPHNRLRHSPTKSSPLRHALSTRSNGSDVDSSGASNAPPNAISFPSPLSQAQISSNQCDPFFTARTSVKRDRSESPVKKSAAFAKWEEREQAEQELNGSPVPLRRVDTTKTNPKKLRDQEWRGHDSQAEVRAALQPVAINTRTETKPSTPPRSESLPYKENAASISPGYPVDHRSRESSPKPLSHSRSQSFDIHSVSPSNSPFNSAGPMLSHKNSLGTLSRSDSMRASTRPRQQGHVRFNSAETPLPTLGDDDIAKLQKSSTPQLRHLSKLASESGTDELSVHSPDEQVVGLAGRRKLQRAASTRGQAKQQSQFASQFTSTKWMDTQRKHLQAYEYLCHIGEARAWLQDVLEPTELPAIVQLEEALRDGVTLAETVVRLAPELTSEQQRALGSLRIFRSDKLQYRHSDNIAMFFRFLAEIELPELFRFELIDLYEKKNVPKVIYCIHALSWLLYRKGIVDFRIGNLLGHLQFADHELEEAQRGIDRSGIQMPNFGGMREAMQIDIEPPEPTPEELLQEHEDIVVDLQSQIRGAMMRMQLGSLMQDLWDAEPSIALFQTLVRGEFAREIFAFKRSMDSSTRMFQAAAKGSLVRARQQQQQHIWSANTHAITLVQSLWRGRQQRRKTQTIKSQLQLHRHGIKELQAAIRGALGRWRASDIWYETQEAGHEIEAVQAAIRGALERQRITRLLNALDSADRGVVELQALLRGSQVRRNANSIRASLATQGRGIFQFQALAKGLIQRRKVRRDHGQLEKHTTGLVNIQSVAKGYILRSRQTRLKAELKKHPTAIVNLQTAARGVLRRNHIQNLRQDLSHDSNQVVDLQSAIRAMLHRRCIGLQLGALEDQELNICQLQSMARAYLERQRVYEHLLEMEKHQGVIVDLQARARAMLTRDWADQAHADLEDCEDTIVELQALGRAFMVRAKFKAKQKHYRDNMAKVIKLQSFVRAKQQGESYQALVNGKNPPLPVVRRHLHLLTDTHLEFESDIEAERLRRQVVESVRRNELVEGYVEGLDVKIALLVKNKITLDEVVKHQKHYGGSASQLLRNGSNLNTPGAGFDLKALNKSSRRKLTGYEELFFLLQTQPHYLSGLFRQFAARGLPDKDAKIVEKHVMTVFGHGQKSREEYFLLKLIADSVQQIAASSQNLDEFVRQHSASFTQRLVTGYMRGPKDRAYLKALLGSLIREEICARDHLDLESDPLQIYRAILNHEELSTGRASNRPREIPREVAIREHDVRSTYVQHLQDLRDLCDGFFVALEQTLHRIPYGIRYVLAEQYHALTRRFSRDDRTHILMLIGNWLWRSYLFPTLKEPEVWGVTDRGLSPSHKRNLAQVVIVLGQVTSGRVFGSENLYLQPLNNWISESLERWHEALQQILDIPSAEEFFNADEYSDLYARNKPILYMKPADIFAIHSLVNENLQAIAPARNDILREILTDLGTAKSNESDLSGAARGGEITLTLKSRYTVQEDPSAEARALFTATKRLVLYLIKVQSGSNLTEILTRRVTHEDEDRWVEVLEEEHAEKSKEQRRSKRPPSAFDSRSSVRGGRAQSVYSEAPSAMSDDRRELMDLENMTYAVLKQTALENILLLQRTSTPIQFRVSREHNYQEILNALAADIRQKHRRRLERQRETESTRATLHQLDSKAQFLEEQLKSYNDYIEQCLHTLASKKGSKHKFTMPFTKQWSHERELEKLGRQPKFGSYKYSARQLADKGVLLSWDGYAHEHWGQLNVVISSDEVGVFHVEASSGSMLLPGGSADLLLENLLEAQYDNKSSITVFEEADNGGARLAVNLLLHLVFKKFYRDE